MRFFQLLLCIGVVLALAGGAAAELTQVEVGGSLRIRGNMYEMDQAGADMSFLEQRTRLNVTARFTDDVTAFIEIDSYDIWGEDFRSNYVTGVDARAASGDDVEMYQAYIEAEEMWGVPIRLRVGRQELSFGSGWLVGVNDESAFFTGLSFDALRLTYATDVFSVDAFAAKLAESFGDWGDDDLDFYGIYGSYTGFEDVVIDAYWLFIRDDVAFAGADADLHTVGARVAGALGAIDLELEGAYQFGDIEIPDVFWYDNDLEYGTFAVNLEAGYTFDLSWQPRVFGAFAYFGGEDEDGKDLSFNRLFSNWEYSEFLANTDLSNIFVYQFGVSAIPTECIDLKLQFSYFEADETIDGGWWFWRWAGDQDEGLEAGLYADYRYSADLLFRAGYAHFFADDGIGDGNLVTGNGLLPFQGDEDDDYHYLFIESELTF